MSRYSSVKTIEDKKVQRIGTATLPDVKESNNDILLIATEGDRCDLLATTYYGTPNLWWFVATVNKLSSNNIPVGTQLRIPVSAAQAILE
tara:strand:- start:214 stop:483 length:270 start_codon:yes stop_codon:yes gene_type:complete